MKKILIAFVLVLVFAAQAIAQVEVGPRVVWSNSAETKVSLDVKFSIGALALSGFSKGENIYAVLGIAPLSLGEKTFAASMKVLGALSLDPNEAPEHRISYGFGMGVDLRILPFGTRFYNDNLFFFKPDNTVEYLPSVGVSFDVLKILILVTNSVSESPLGTDNKK